MALDAPASGHGPRWLEIGTEQRSRTRRWFRACAPARRTCALDRAAGPRSGAE